VNSAEELQVWEEELLMVAVAATAAVAVTVAANHAPAVRAEAEEAHHLHVHLAADAPHHVLPQETEDVHAKKNCGRPENLNSGLLLFHYQQI
jgi:hypothetical protein